MTEKFGVFWGWDGKKKAIYSEENVMKVSPVWKLQCILVLHEVTTALTHTEQTQVSVRLSTPQSWSI